jgi:hypothetical protein
MRNPERPLPPWPVSTMNDTPKNEPSDEASPALAAQPERMPAGTLRLPSRRASVVLASAMLAVGVALGAAIGPAPETSLAGNAGIIEKLPALIATLAAERQAAAPPATIAAVQPPAVTPQATPASSSSPAIPASSASPSSPSTPAAQPSPTPSTTNTSGGKATLPPITSVWLIELSGVSFADALAAPTAAPYISGQLIPMGTYLSSWSALSASAFANDAALAEHKAALGATPPLLHSIVQPPCPEGAPGAACASGTPGALRAADEFLKLALASITTTTTYGEHGLVVVTFATVGNATASELPSGASTATLTSQPPAGVVLLSPFAKAGARPSTTFNPTSPRQSLEKLLH